MKDRNTKRSAGRKGGLATLALLLLALVSLACSLTPTAAQVSGAVSTPTPLPSPIAIPTAPKPTATPAPITCEVIAAEALHLRDAPGINGSVIAWLLPGEILTLSPAPSVDEWVNVTISADLNGWVNSKFIKCEVTHE